MTLLNMLRIFVKSNPPYWLELQRDPKSVGFSTTKPSSGWELGLEAGRSRGGSFFSFSPPFFFQAAWYSIDYYNDLICFLKWVK